MGLSPMEIGLVILVAVLMFGPNRIAGIGKGLGQGIRNFKRGLSDSDEDDREATRAAESSPGLPASVHTASTLHAEAEPSVAKVP